jgi:hypothetical protein
LYPDSEKESGSSSEFGSRKAKRATKKKKGEKKEQATLPFITIYRYIFLRIFFSGGPEADAVRIFLPRIGKQGATKIF